jgi:hypothetical protein
MLRWKVPNPLLMAATAAIGLIAFSVINFSSTVPLLSPMQVPRATRE